MASNAFRVIAVVVVLVTGGCVSCPETAYFKPSAVTGNGTAPYSHPGRMKFQLADGAVTDVFLVDRIHVAADKFSSIGVDIKLNEGRTLQLLEPTTFQVLNARGDKVDLPIHKISPPYPPTAAHTPDVTVELKGARDAAAPLFLRSTSEEHNWRVYTLTLEKPPSVQDEFVVTFPRMLVNGVEVTRPSISFKRAKERVCHVVPLQ